MGGGSYTQVKASINSGIAAKFKAECAAAGLSMAGVLSEFMAGYPDMAFKRGRPAITVRTRQQRRKAVKHAIAILESARENEEAYHDNFPESLEGAPLHEASGESVAALEDAIECLRAIYD
jgi:hypothetical protein